VEGGSRIGKTEHGCVRDQRSHLQGSWNRELNFPVAAIADRGFIPLMETKSHRPRLKRLSFIRLSFIRPDNPVYFITCCVHRRIAILNRPSVHDILLDEWQKSDPRHGWHIGSYVIMPDHVHFLAMPDQDSKSLSRFMQAWKQWTSKRITLATRETRLWQKQFFDRLVRSEESRSEKWDYIRKNPIRAGLVEDLEDWPYQGYIHFR